MKVALAMMARDSAEVVLRAIESARPFVDRVCLVVAPGSPLLSLDLPIPGRIWEHEWEGHAKTRTTTLRRAEGDIDVDWVLMIDAHTTIAGTLPPLAEDIDVDSYEIAIEDVPSRWRWMRQGHLMRAWRGFEWTGAVHETLVPPTGAVVKQWPGLVLRGTSSTKVAGQGRSYAEDARMLRAELEKNPTATRTAYYYAQSLKDAGQYREAFEAFGRRATMGGWAEETFWALMWCAKLAPFIGENTVALYLKAHAAEPERAEPLAALEALCRTRGDHALAGYYGRLAASKPYPTSARLFVELPSYSDESLRAAGIAA